jgi:hypothetical protein
VSEQIASKKGRFSYVLGEGYHQNDGKIDQYSRQKVEGFLTGSIFILLSDNTFFSKHQKKDDLSDCFLQGMWYIKHNKNV